MKFLSGTAAKTFAKVIDGLKEPGDAKKIDTSKGAFMPVCVDFLGKEGGTRFYSIAHYYKSNGDLCADPDVQFAVREVPSTRELLICPFAITQPFGYREVAQYVAGQVQTYRPRAQADLATFCTTWLRNIKQQQAL